jgi:Na+/melibiose symporter-like transporter
MLICIIRSYEIHQKKLDKIREELEHKRTQKNPDHYQNMKS